MEGLFASHASHVPTTVTFAGWVLWKTGSVEDFSLKLGLNYIFYC